MPDATVLVIDDDPDLRASVGRLLPLGLDAQLFASISDFLTLSPREREIMIQVAHGRLSKQIAGDIGIGRSHREGASAV
jgi:FixJ family two-component response regulator